MIKRRLKKRASLVVDFLMLAISASLCAVAASAFALLGGAVVTACATGIALSLALGWPLKKWIDNEDLAEVNRSLNARPN